MQRKITYLATVVALMLMVGVPLACGDDGGNIVDEPECGDGIMEGTEECDMDDFGGQFCSDINELFVRGYLYCLPTCEIDVAHCELPECGDDLAEGNEECDGLDMGPIADCTNHGYRCGYTTCDNETCTLNTDECVLEVPCNTIYPEITTEEVSGGTFVADGEFSYLYDGLIDGITTTHTWKLHLRLLGDFVPGGGGLNTDPITFTDADLDISLGESPYQVLLMQCMTPACCFYTDCTEFPLKYHVPKAGTLQLTSLGQAPGTALSGTLDGIEWKEINIDWETGDGSDFECGNCYAPDASLTFDATLQ